MAFFLYFDIQGEDNDGYCPSKIDEPEAFFYHQKEPGIRRHAPIDSEGNGLWLVHERLHVQCVFQGCG